MNDRICQRNHTIPAGRVKCPVCTALPTMRKRAERSTGANELTPEWYDQVAVDRALTGRPVGRDLTLAERREYLRLQEEMTDVDA